MDSKLQNFLNIIKKSLATEENGEPDVIEVGADQSLSDEDARKVKDLAIEGMALADEIIERPAIQAWIKRLTPDDPLLKFLQKMLALNHFIHLYSHEEPESSMNLMVTMALALYLKGREDEKQGIP